MKDPINKNLSNRMDETQDQFMKFKSSNLNIWPMENQEAIKQHRRIPKLIKATKAFTLIRSILSPVWLFGFFEYNTRIRYNI